jgi:hypothetical protein
MPDFAYTPYDGSKKPFSIGLAPLDLSDWIEPDERLLADLAEKDALFADRRDVVFREELGSRPAQAETLDRLAAFLAERRPAFYRRDGDTMLVGDGRRVALAGDEPPLMTAARLIQDDLVIMQKGEGGYRLVAAALCFPSSWSLAEKFGGSLDQIHAVVPGYAETMAARMNRIFDALKVEMPVWRMNWSLYPDAELHHPESRQRPRDWFQSNFDAFVRVERQTLRRLPDTGDILFTIRIYVDPIAALARHPEGPRLARGLRAQLLALDPAQLRYKNMVEHRDLLATGLEQLADGGSLAPAAASGGETVG